MIGQVPHHETKKVSRGILDIQYVDHDPVGGIDDSDNACSNAERIHEHLSDLKFATPVEDVRVLEATS